MQDNLLQIELLGRIRVRCGEKSVVYPISSKNGLLLAWLALHSSEPQERSKLAAKFWPETNNSSDNLRRALSTLREEWKAWGLSPDEILITPRSLVQLNPLCFTTDVQNFESLYQSGMQAEGITRIEFLAAAVELYQGDLLEGLVEQGVEKRRQQLRGKFVRALEMLIAAYEQNGDLQRAIEMAHKAVCVDPLKEAASLRLMRLYAAAGQPASVESCYLQLKHCLAQKNQVPLEETRIQYETLLQRAKDAPGSETSPRIAAPMAPAEQAAEKAGAPSIAEAASPDSENGGDADSPDEAKTAPRTNDVLPGAPQVREPSRRNLLIAGVAAVTLPGLFLFLKNRLSPSGEINPFPLKVLPWLVYESARQGHRHLIGRNTDGSETQLTFGPTVNCGGKVSPDGRRIVFHSERDDTEGLYILDLKTGVVTPLTQGTHDVEPCWSPDGTRVAFTRNGGNHDAIWIIHANGTGARQISSPDLFSADKPAWAHGKDRISFTGYYKSYPEGVQPQGDLWAIDADGKNPKKLSRLPGENTCSAWSFDDSKIAFIRRRGLIKGEIYTVQPRDSMPECLLSDRAIRSLTWSPYGSQMVFSEGDPQHLFVLELTNKKITQLTGGVLDTRPDWFPSYSSEQASR